MKIEKNESLAEMKKRKVRELLLMPIICEKNGDKKIVIKKENQIIITSQQYYSTADEDMSDFAVEFYKILYGENLLKDKELLKNGTLVNKELAGDTMNSFNTIANLFSPYSYRWDGENQIVSVNPYLLNYKARYHCLANFWLIPMRHGRMSAKRVKNGKETYDSPVLYMESIQEKWSSLSEESVITYRNDENKYKNFFTMLKSDVFSEVHCFPSCINGVDLRKKYEDKNGLDLVKESLGFIIKRADKICENSNIVEKLYSRFKDLKLLD